jgi:hypothetical protein
MINVEAVGGKLIVQHYRPVRADRSFVDAEARGFAADITRKHQSLPAPAELPVTFARVPQTFG